MDVEIRVGGYGKSEFGVLSHLSDDSRKSRESQSADKSAVIVDSK